MIEVEKRIGHLEVSFGRERLMSVVNDIAVDDAHDHIGRYREIIRGHAWPNVVQPHVGPTEFIANFGLAACGYVDAAFAAAQWLETRDGDTLAVVHRIVLTSEALRGQLGKSSPDGLDERLERVIDELACHLGDDEHLYLACAIPPSVLPAEAALVVDFLAMREEFTSMPDWATLVALPATSVAWKFFRRYCRWRLDRFAELWENFALVSTPKPRSPHTNESRAELLADLPLHARHLADYAAALNVLNLCLEPTLSFKGGAGLLHAEVFRAAAHLAPSPALCQLALDREHLLHQIHTTTNNN